MLAATSTAEDNRFVELTSEALRLLGEEAATERSLLLSGLAMYRFAWEGRAAPAARHLSAAALELARDSGDAAALITALRVRALTLCSPGAAERLTLANELVRMGYDTRDPSTLAYGTWIRMTVELELGDARAFDRSLVELHAAATASGWWGMKRSLRSASCCAPSWTVASGR